MLKFFLFLCLPTLVLLAVGCKTASKVTESTSGSEETFNKVSMTLDLDVSQDGSITNGNACFSQGTIATVLYFEFEGGKPIAQTSTLTVDSVSCLSCRSDIKSSTTTFPIELSAILNPNSVAISVGDESMPSVMANELRFWIDTPPVFPLDIYYDCDLKSPGVATDYGSAVSQIASPFMTSVWTQDLVLNEVKVSTFEDYIFPPTYKADVTISVIGELVDKIE